MASQAMDVHSDNGDMTYADIDLDLTYPDIELDLDPAPHTQHPDDDVSIQDAASINGAGVQSTNAEDDDYMVDNEDLIEEAVQSQGLGQGSPAKPNIAIIDEDLIDYSDDEQPYESQPSKLSTNLDDGEPPNTWYELENANVKVGTSDSDGGVQIENDATIDEIVGDVEESVGNVDEIVGNVEESVGVADTVYDVDGAGHVEGIYFQEVDAENQESKHHTHEYEGHSDDDEDPGRTDGVSLQEYNRSIENFDDEYDGDDQAEEHDPSEKHQSEEYNQSEEHDQSEEHNLSEEYDQPGEHDDFGEHHQSGEHHHLGEHHQSHSPFEESQEQSYTLHSVTVNYDGNDHYLFKRHDIEGSGDYLLENSLVATETMRGLFSAIRLALSDVLTNEHEIGLRFDHLQGLELYEDNTACVTVSLDMMVSMYCNLHAQDGHDNPASFYMTLLFRPRFITLYADIAKFRDQGSGFSGLEAAMAAGETHFSNLLSNSSSEEHEPQGWENEEQEDHPQYEEIQLPTLEGQTYTGDQEHYEEHEDGFDELNEQEEYQQDDGDQRSPVEVEAGENHDLDTTSNSNPPTGIGEQLAQDMEALVEELRPEDLTTPKTDAQREQELGDLIEYSDDEDEQATDNAPFHGTSPSSATVQGDDLVPQTEDKGLVGSYDQAEQIDNKTNQAESHTELVNDDAFNDELLISVDNPAQQHQDHDETYDEDLFQNFVESEDVNPDIHNGVEIGTVTETGDLFDLDTEWAADQGPASVVSEDKTDASVDKINASPNGQSLQNKKRSVEDAGYEGDNGSAGMFSPASSLRCSLNADSFAPDPKRVKV